MSTKLTFSEIEKTATRITGFRFAAEQIDELSKIDDKRLLKALELLEQTLYNNEGIQLTQDLKNKATEAFKGWHAQDKANKITMDSIAQDPGKKAEG